MSKSAGKARLRKIQDLVLLFIIRHLVTLIVCCFGEYTQEKGDSASLSALSWKLFLYIARSLSCWREFYHISFSHIVNLVFIHYYLLHGIGVGLLCLSILTPWNLCLSKPSLPMLYLLVLVSCCHYCMCCLKSVSILLATICCNA